MRTNIKWGDDLIAPEQSDDIALESLTAGITATATTNRQLAPYFNPINIVVEDGIHYVTLYACCVGSDEKLIERFSVWLSQLKETDCIKLSVSALVTGIPFSEFVDLLGAFANTKAQVDIQLDQIVVDGLAYFYLLADKVTKGYAGALFIPSYTVQREEHASAPWKAVHDLYKWIVEEAVSRGRLTEEEAERLHSGNSVVVPATRFEQVSE